MSEIDEFGPGTLRPVSQRHLQITTLAPVKTYDVLIDFAANTVTITPLADGEPTDQPERWSLDNEAALAAHLGEYTYTLLDERYEDPLYLPSPGSIPGIPGGPYAAGHYLVDYTKRTLRPGPGDGSGGPPVPAETPAEAMDAPPPDDLPVTQPAPSNALA